MTDTAYHQLDRDAALTAVSSAPHGLTAEEAAARLVRHGPNRLPAPPSRGPLRRFLGQVNSLLVWVLIGAGAVTAALGHWIDTGVILGIVAINAVIGFLQEGKAEAAMSAIRQMLAPQAAVLRDGQRVTVAGEALVPGDIVLLEAGDRVPADLRLIETHGLRMDEAVLSGESVPEVKETDPVATDTPLGDRVSMAYSGTLVTQGTGRGVVTATGAATEIGRIGGLLAATEDLSTPLVRQMDRFARLLSVAILAASALLLALGWGFALRPFDDLFLAVVGMAVAAIPEGLPAVMTIALAIGVQAMARRNAIVRRLPAIEAVGSVSVICTDKTGTLTMNEMTVARVVTPVGRFAVEGQGYAPEGGIVPDGDLRALALAARACNDARLVQGESGDWRVEGDPMEGALLAFAARAGLVGDGPQRLDVLPFDAQHRYMAVRVACGDGPRLMVKGAPERVLAMCSDAGDEWVARAEALATEGMRVLALAEGADASLDAEPRNLMLLGLVGLIDPPRPEAVAAVAECRGAGIGVKMITGDHPETARAIAGAVGLARADQVLTGADLDAMDDLALSAAVLDCDVFARTSPSDKLRLVAALQGHGLSVAMTGDGVNDAPALRRADAGVAMGRKGSEAAKEASDLVLADDNFASIAAAVAEGRRVYDNLRKVIRFELPTSFGESAVVVLALLLGMVLPITAVQILWVNMVTGVTLGLVLAFEPAEPGLMRRPPRQRGEGLVSGVLLWQIALISLLFMAAAFGVFAWSQAQGHDLAHSRTLVLNTLVALEIANLFAIRRMHVVGNPLAAFRAPGLVWASVGMVIVAQAAVSQIPAFQPILGTRALSATDLALISGIAAGFYALLEVEKLIRLTLGR